MEQEFNIDYKSWLERELSRYLQGAVDHDITIKYEEEFSYQFDYREDVVVTIAKLKAQNNSGWINQPYQLMIMCKQELYDTLKNAFDRFSIDYNEARVNMGVVTDESGASHNVMAIHYYTPHAILQRNVSVGIYKYVMLTIDGAIQYNVSYKGLVKTTEIKLNNHTIRVLNTALAWKSQTTSTGSVANSNKQYTSNQLGACAYTFIVVAEDIEWLTSLVSRKFNNENINEVVRLILDKFDIDKKCVMTDLSYNDSVTDIPSYTMTLCETEA